MDTLNHRIRDEYDIELAMIEGTDIEALCGVRFIPSVTVGTSGQAYEPAAGICEICQEIFVVDAIREKLRREQDRIALEMRKLEEERERWRELARQEREQEEEPQLA